MLELASLMARQARYRPDATAVVFENERLTYRQFWVRVARVGNMLRALGVGPGDKVATVAGNSASLLETYWAVPTIGATLVPLSPLLLATGLASLLHDSDARCLVTQASMLPVLREMRAELPPHVLLIDAAAETGFGDYQALAATQPDTLVPATVTPDTLFNIMYTSGTTGLPKGIMHTHFIRSMYAALFASSLRMAPESKVLQTGAIVFNGALVTMLPAFYCGASYHPHRQFDAAETRWRRSSARASRTSWWCRRRSSRC